VPRFSFCLLAFSCVCSPARAQAAFLPPIEPSQAIQGSLVLSGGGFLPDSVYDAFLKLAGGSNAHLVIIPTAGGDDAAKDVGKYLQSWKKHGPASVEFLHTSSATKANDPAFVKPLTKATGVWLDGGDQTRLMNAYRGTAVEGELHKLLERGGVIGGTSAGAAVMGLPMIAGGKDRAKLGTGFGFLPGGIVDQHFLKRNRANRLLNVLEENPGWFGLCIDEGTAVVAEGRTLTVVGNSYAVVCLAASKDRPTGIQVLKAGDKADLIALSRAALARSRTPQPPLHPAAPMVPNGALIIGGGGGLPDPIWTKFIELAGGPDTNIVCISTALDFPLKEEPGEAKRLKKLGALHVTSLHAQSRAEANSAAFLKQLRAATGLWFTGGRQWRLVDAYENTASYEAFHAVLARGGAIGGSSAGASIQADYMVRGDPLGNLNIMAEGYEQGFGFLKGVAIDQHFLKRKRTGDMSLLMDRYPQLLGIGIDEGTALYVHGSTMEVMGRSNVLVYDRAHANNDGRDYRVLTPGSRYDLRRREQ
jgi:cyanophycinase